MIHARYGRLYNMAYRSVQKMVYNTGTIYTIREEGHDLLIHLDNSYGIIKVEKNDGPYYNNAKCLGTSCGIESPKSGERK